ncbi:MAG TPA: SMC family ATPase [Actinomycetota bacterium]
MRPLKLEIAGFTAFREHIEVDFEGVDYFALVGPTGSGKSSVIDAICFALYGKVPRLDMRSVEPVISQGKQEARVRLDFAIGEQRYTAARVVRRMGQDRATTKEARLERGDEVIAGDADGVSAEVERLLGLGFVEFTRCVVLPQGEFARFMHDKPADRQELLVKLLDLAVYGRMAQRANQRATLAETELVLQRRRLDEELAFATKEALDQARAHLASLDTLRERIEAEEPRLEELRETVRVEREKATAARAATGALAGVRVPDGIEQLAQVLSGATGAAKTAEEAAARADEAVTTVEAARAALPDRGELKGALGAHEQRAVVALDLGSCSAEATKLEAAAAEAAQGVERAERAVHDAQHALEIARIQHRALDLAGTLVAGGPCPVCHQTVHDIPAIDVPADLDEARTALDTATAAAKDSKELQARAQTALTRSAARADALREQLAAIEQRLAAHPDAAVVQAALAEVDAADTQLAEARTAAREARAAATKTRRTVEAAEEALKGARRELAATRDRIANLSPPPLSHDDLAADWRDLVSWAAEERDRRATEAEAADARAAKAAEEGTALVAAQRAACVDAGIEEDASPRDDCLKAIERHRGITERIELALEEAERIRGEVTTLAERHVVAKELGKHLKANAFERWVLTQAITSLTDGATQILREISAGQYSLTIDKNHGFAVIDHRNADATRSARTLSGGETFLASLALALAMSDRIAQLSAHTAVRLESIFLDEGFGTLDPETLETVATTIETLGAGKRMVGIVTHVRDLAERVPVRFEVRKGPSTATVDRVLA